MTITSEMKSKPLYFKCRGLFVYFARPPLAVRK